MSALPAGQQTSRTPNGAGHPPRRIVVQRPANPLVQRKPRPRPQQQQQQQQQQHPNQPPQPPHPTQQQEQAQPEQFFPLSKIEKLAAAGLHPFQEMKIKKREESPLAEVLGGLPAGDSTPSLFSHPPLPGTYTDIPIVMSKKAMMAGLQHHVARLSSKKPIDPSDPNQFTRPVYLLRRDHRAPLPGSKDWEEQQARARERMEAAAAMEDAERVAEKAAVQAEIAPTTGSNSKKKPTRGRSNIEQRYFKESEESKAASQIKYEETMPWHLEDDEHKQIWMGTYEGASSKSFVELRYEDGPQGPRYVLVPVQKWYKFVPKMRGDPEVIRELEEKRVKEETGQRRMQLSGDPEEKQEKPKFMRVFDKIKQEEEQDESEWKRSRNLHVGKVGAAYDEQGGRGIKQEDEFEVDFEDDFADDEAPPEIEGEEDEVKETQNRIKKDQLSANFLAWRAQKDYEKEEEVEIQKKKQLEKVGKQVQKALYKREKNAMYESDDENPYFSGDSSPDTEEEREKEKLRKEEEAKKAAASNTATAAGKSDSGTNSRNNTPGNRASKHPDPAQKLGGNLKRPGSPNLSDASGNESSAARKKQKKNAAKGPSKLGPSGPPSRAQTPVPGSQARPPPPTAKTSFAGSGSDSEGAGSRKLKLTSPRSPNGTPTIRSRAASPAPGAPKKRTTMPTKEELQTMIPAEGISMLVLAAKFQLKKEDRREVIRMVREVAHYDKATGMLTRMKK